MKKNTEKLPKMPINFRIRADLFDQLKEAADAVGATQIELLEEAVEDYFAGRRISDRVSKRQAAMEKLTTKAPKTRISAPHAGNPQKQ